MTVLVIIGTATTVVGLLGLVLCIRRAASIRDRDAPPEEKRRALNALIPLNLGSVCVSFLGLGFVVLGLIL
ncbi:MAG: hypothetical protein AAF913_17435 [Pseudomonadota bacterium]